MSEIETYIAQGYALLLQALARTLRCPHCQRPFGDAGVPLWRASLKFTTADMLERGENPFATVPPRSRQNRPTR